VGIDASFRLGRSRPRAVSIDCQELPGAGYATQLDGPAVLEARARADHQVTHGAGNEDFTGAGLAQDARRDVYCNAPDVGVEQFAFARVDASADLDAQCFGVSTQGLGAADGLRRAVERGEVAVAGALDHRAAESFREFGGDLTKAVQHCAPPLVARGRGVCRRGDHIGEQHGAQGAT
jgi:hypothetical protein